MNLPNKLSILRIAMIPLMVALLYPDTPACNWLAAGVFALAALTDFLDGHIARKRNLITDLGRFLDPVADKLLVLSAMIMLIKHGLMPAWVTVLILARELAVDGLRMVAVAQGRVIAASWPGKVKTVSQIVLVLWLMVTRIPVSNHWLGVIIMIWVIMITVWSGLDYLYKNGDALRGGKTGTEQ